jgi:hypothetical protein
LLHGGSGSSANMASRGGCGGGRQNRGRGGRARAWQWMSQRCRWRTSNLSYGPPWAHYLGGYQDRLLGGPLGLPGLCHTAPDGVRRKDYGGEVLR